MKKILSIQSHVAYGYVGNKAAAFPLQRLGYDVMPVNTVQFSNHTGYGHWTGDIFSAAHVQSVIDGITARGIISETSAILSGYMGSAELGAVIVKTVREWREQNKKLIFCCDPVLPGADSGCFVRPEIAQFIKTEAINVVDILTPNQFELSFLSDTPIHHFSDVLHACQKLHVRGPKIILVTGLSYEGMPSGQLQMLVSSPAGQWTINTPYLPMKTVPNGTGDLTAAIFLAKYLEAHDVVKALEHVAASVYEICKKTMDLGQRELAVIAGQESIVHPALVFRADKVLS